MPPRSVGRRLSPSPALVDRFRRDLVVSGGDSDELEIVVAVSGGSDSVALLLLTQAAVGERCLAVTVDHGLRAASAEEARWVAELCAERGIEHRILSGSLPERAGRTANLSARARQLRYRLFEGHLEELGWPYLATAHHADDQLETMIMRLNRGAGVTGLAGVRHHRGCFIRPLLRWRRRELAALVAQCGIVAIDDPSNIDDRFDRARLRKALATADWLDAERFVQSAAALRDADDALAWATRRAKEEFCVFGEGEASFRAGRVPFEIQRRLALLCLCHIDPHVDPPGPALVRFCQQLSAGRRSMIGNALATPIHARTWEEVWHFRAAPPRRTS